MASAPESFAGTLAIDLGPRRTANEPLVEGKEREKENGFKRVLSVVGGGRDAKRLGWTYGHHEGKPLTDREEKMATEQFEGASWFYLFILWFRSRSSSLSLSSFS